MIATLLINLNIYPFLAFALNRAQLKVPERKAESVLNRQVQGYKLQVEATLAAPKTPH
jgi:hypothetical protein